MSNMDTSLKLSIRCARLRFASVLPLVLLVSACTNDTTAERFFPLRPGMTWQYRLQRTTMDGTADMRYAVTSLAPATADAGVSAVRETLGGYRYLYSADDSGIFRVGEHEQAQAIVVDQRNRQLVLPHNATLNSSWRGVSRTSVLENSGPPWETLFRVDVPVPMDYTVESVNAAVKTPAGHFSGCLIVVGQGQTTANVGNYIGDTAIAINSREWFAPGVGLVRMERHESTAADALSAGSMTMELDSWND